MRKIISCLVLGGSYFMPANAQMSYSPLGEPKDKADAMFEVYKEDLDINFQVNVSKGVMLHFSMTGMGLWKGEEEFRRPLNQSVEQLKLYADSLKPFANSKRLDVHIGEDGKDVFSRYSRSGIHNDIRMDNGGRLEALKLNKDTLRIVRVFPLQKPLWKAQKVQYTFEVKELKDFSALLQDEKWIASTAHLIDSVIMVYKEKWRNPDAAYHSLYVRYLPKDTIQPLVISKRSIGEYNKMSGLLIIDGGFGVSLVRNSLCPNVNLGMRFHFKGEDDYVTFVRLSMNTFTRFEERADKKFSSYTTGFVNAEFGMETNEKNKFNKDFLFSIGLGYKLTTKEQIFRDPSMDKNMYKLFFNYRLTKSIMLQPEIISNLRSKEKYNGWVGMTVNFQLF